MPALLAILSSIIRTGLSYAKWLGGMLKMEFFRLGIQIKKVAAICLYLFTKRAAFWAALLVAYQTLLGTLSFLLIQPLASNVISSLLPSNSWAQGVYYMVWDSGICLKYAFSLLIVYWGNLLLVYRLVDIFAEALSYRIILHQATKDYSLGLLSSSK